MILVTVGSFRFDALIKRVDELAATGFFGKEPVIAQIGSGEYMPKHMEYFRYRTDIGLLYDKASLAICHGGPATMAAFLRRGCPFVAVANPSLADNHQSDTLAAMHRRDWCTWCQSLDDLPQALRHAFSARVPDTHMQLSCSIANFFRERTGAKLGRGSRAIVVACSRPAGMEGST